MKNRKKHLEKQLNDDSPRVDAIPPENYLSLGAKLLNVAVTGRHDAGIAKGLYLYFVGDSSSGKTLATLGLLAEACMNPEFDDYRLIYDGPEFGNLFDIERFYGKKLAKRLEPPRGTRKKPRFSETVQEFFYNSTKLVKEGPCIYIMDSFDALMSDEENEKFEEEVEAHEKGKEIKGSFALATPKYISRNIKRTVSLLQRNGSVLVGISQTRDKIGGYGGRTRSGGRALKFYSHVEIWTSIKKVLTRTVLKKEREYGKLCIFDIQKNRADGWEGKIELPILRNHGVDDTGASVDFLVSEKFWKSTDGIIAATQFKFKGRREDLIEKIESSDKRMERLAFMLQAHWRKIDEATRLKRRKRYE